MTERKLSIKSKSIIPKKTKQTNNKTHTQKQTNQKNTFCGSPEVFSISIKESTI